MARFKTEVKMFAIKERDEGKMWQVIQKRIREKFNIEPPTVRAMQKWEKTLDRQALSAELMKDIKSEMPSIQSQAQVEFVQKFLPVLWEAKDSGQDVELAGWKCFLNIIERRLGSQSFEQLITEYMSERKM
jgi:hypothetical protein